MSRAEHETPEDARRWLADHYARPQRPRVPDLSHVTGAMQPIEYEMAEGSAISGRQMVHHVLRRTGTRYDQHMLGVTEQPLPLDWSYRDIARHLTTVAETGEHQRFRDANGGTWIFGECRPIVPTRSYVNRPSRAGARESVALIVAVALLVASLVWGAAGMPL